MCTHQGEAALFEDIKAKDEDGSTTFTTAARVVSQPTHVLALDIRCVCVACACVHLCRC